jgi:hypothetical protein
MVVKIIINKLNKRRIKMLENYIKLYSDIINNNIYNLTQKVVILYLKDGDVTAAKLEIVVLPSVQTRVQ